LRQYVLSLDQGTTSSRAILFDEKCRPLRSEKQEFRQIFPRPGWVEHDPAAIWSSQMRAAKRVTMRHENMIAGIGITNQRETTVVWDRRTGKPVHNAIVWQDRRTAPIIDDLISRGYNSYIRRTTGLVPDAYFSGPKVKWLLDNIPKAKRKARQGDLLFGTIDTFLIWKLTGGRVHTTDHSNASRTMIFDINRRTWDRKLLDILEIPSDMLPEVRSSSEVLGYTDERIFRREIPISGVAGDQQAALFGQAGFENGAAKNTYGTGCFVLSNTGNRPPIVHPGLISTIAWSLNHRVTYALEGSVFIAGAIIQWLRDRLGLLKKDSDSELIGRRTPSSGGVFLVPALTGIGAPYWNMYARGLIIGITRDTTRNQIVRAALESICLQTVDVLEAMTKTTGRRLRSLRVDGGASVNNFLMQLQADLLGLPIERSAIAETTALGAAFLAGLAVGVWNDLNQLKSLRRVDRVFRPAMPVTVRTEIREGWSRAVQRALDWARPGARSGPTGNR
jgi:glycerol kinase